jgi:hypothetical protein
MKGLKMSKIASRTVHVTIKLSVEVPVTEANTDREARIWAQEMWEKKGNVYDTQSVVFERTTEEEMEQHERKKFRDLHIGKKK